MTHHRAGISEGEVPFCAVAPSTIIEALEMTMESYTPDKQQQLRSLMSEILQERYVNISAVRVEIREDMQADETTITCLIKPTASDGDTVEIRGQGVGAVDALFAGLKAHYAANHLSIDTISFFDFDIKGQMDTSKREDGADAQAAATVRIRNSYGTVFAFGRTSRSIIRAAIRACLDAVEYFVNSERATVALHKALVHARAAGREDTVADYTAKLARLVENASYTEVIEKIRESVR